MDIVFSGTIVAIRCSTVTITKGENKRVKMERWMPNTTINEFRMLFQIDGLIIIDIGSAVLERFTRVFISKWGHVKLDLLNNFKRLTQFGGCWHRNCL